MSQATRLLAAVERGEIQAADELLPLVYEELRQVARARLAGERAGQTLQPTALVHEAWLRLLGEEQEPRAWQGRSHFFRAAAEAMRRILVDNARRKQAVRHGGGLHRTELDEVALPAGAPDEELMAVHEALDELATQDSAKAELVKLRYFMGLTLEEASDVLQISVPTAKRHWAYARAWLFRRIQGSGTTAVEK